MHLGILHCGHPMPEIRRRYGEYSDMFAALFAGRGWRFSTWNVVDMEFPDSPRYADAWLLSGSRHGAYDDLPFIPPLEDFIRRGFAAGAPMVGICFGHQIIAQALGGRVEKFQGGWALGRQSYEIGDVGTVVLNAWHQDQVLSVPEGAQTVVRNGFCGNAGFAIHDRVLTLQPHPEFTDDIMADMAKLQDGNSAYPADLKERVARGTDAPLGAASAADWLAGFLERAHVARKEEELTAHG